MTVSDGRSGSFRGAPGPRICSSTGSFFRAPSEPTSDTSPAMVDSMSWSLPLRFDTSVHFIRRRHRRATVPPAGAGEALYPTRPMTKLALIALAGAIGTLARYGLTLGLARAFGGRFPLGTLVVNLV